MNRPLSALLILLATAVVAHAQPASNMGATPSALPPEPLPELTEQWEPVPPVINAPVNGAPSDAIVLFDGKNMDAWESCDAKNRAPRWDILPEGAMQVTPKTDSIRTKANFGDVQLHIEWRSPVVVKKEGQGRGNSGILFMEKYEVQVLDSYENKTYVNGQAGAIYKQFPPLVNACRKPGEWQTYDIVFIAPRFNTDGTLASPARVTVFQNGVLIQLDVVLRGMTEYRGQPSYRPHPAKLPIQLQNHGGDLVAFRNVWIRELSFPPAPPTFDNVPPPPYSYPPPQK